MESKDHGLLYKPDMIQAFFENRKSQTRRVLTRMNTILDGDKRASREFWEGFDFNDAFVDSGPSPAGNPGPYLKVFNHISEARHRLYPIYMVGDRMYAKETWWYGDMGDDEYGQSQYAVIYRADEIDSKFSKDYIRPDGERWNSPLFMPKKYARIWRKITNVRIQRLQMMNNHDAIAEGIEKVSDHDYWAYKDYYSNQSQTLSPLMSFHSLWDSINEKRGYPWENNDWVIALTLEEIK